MGKNPVSQPAGWAFRLEVQFPAHFICSWRWRAAVLGDTTGFLRTALLPVSLHLIACLEGVSGFGIGRHHDGHILPRQDPHYGHPHGVRADHLEAVTTQCGDVLHQPAADAVLPAVLQGGVQLLIFVLQTIAREFCPIPDGGMDRACRTDRVRIVAMRFRGDWNERT